MRGLLLLSPIESKCWTFFSQNFNKKRRETERECIHIFESAFPFGLSWWLKLMTLFRRASVFCFCHWTVSNHQFLLVVHVIMIVAFSFGWWFHTKIYETTKEWRKLNTRESNFNEHATEAQKHRLTDLLFNVRCIFDAI